MTDTINSTAEAPAMAANPGRVTVHIWSNVRSVRDCVSDQTKRQQTGQRIQGFSECQSFYLRLTELRRRYRSNIPAFSRQEVVCRQSDLCLSLQNDQHSNLPKKEELHGAWRGRCQILRRRSRQATVWEMEEAMSVIRSDWKDSTKHTDLSKFSPDERRKPSTLSTIHQEIDNVVLRNEVFQLLHVSLYALDLRGGDRVPWHWNRELMSG